jgi:hypothetical protein
MPKKLPIIYIRGYAGAQADVEETVDDPFYGFNVEGNPGTGREVY